ncbi:hypothetical protein ABZ354_04565 [Streptomyces sp. NPDC005925]|uniref:hypothetical protein n=1 Tax=Streptomyces sp. NPDC005925 TaxID=3157172 RepID=UPI0033C4B14B
MNTERPDNDDAAVENGGEEAVPPGPGGTREHGEDDGGGRAARRTPVIVASVVAAVLVVGGGGAYLAAGTSGGSDDKTAPGTAGGGGTPPPLPLDGYAGSGSGPGIAPGEPNPSGATYRAGGTLPDGPGSAPVYRTSGQVGEAEVARLAQALGVDGTPVVEGQAWKIGAKDGAGPSLQVNRQAPGTWTFYRYAPGTDNCSGKPTCASGPAGGAAADPVGEEAAKKAAAPVLKAVGQDDAKLSAGQVQGANRVVNADPLIGGLPTYGWSTGVTVSASGEVVGASGQLKAPVKSDTYPVLDAERTLGLLNAAPGGGPVGISGCASAVPHAEPNADRGGTKPCDPVTGLASPEPKKQVNTVEKAVFALAAQFVSGRQALVPSWLFEVRAPGAKTPFTLAYPAVDPEYIASPTPPAGPTERPSPRPTGPDAQRTAEPRDVAVQGYTAEGVELTVSFTGGVCSDYRVTADESGGKVTVRVTETPRPGKVCIMIAKMYHRTVRLDAPLGGRAVVASHGKPVPLEKPGARLPQAR